MISAEDITAWLLRHLRSARSRRARAERADRSLDVAGSEAGLSLLASLLAGRRLTVQLGATSPGGAGGVFVLPREIDLGATRAENEDHLLVLLALLVAGGALGLSADRAWSPGETALASLAALPVTVAWALEAFPSLGARTQAYLDALERDAATLGDGATSGELRELVRQACRAGAEHVPRAGDVAARPPGPLSGALESPAEAFAALSRRSRRQLCACIPRALPLLRVPGPASAGVETDTPEPAEGGRPTTERSARLRDQPERVAQLAPPETENPLVHSFEKTHTLDDWSGGRKRIDGGDDLAAHAGALDELDLRTVLRTRQRADALYAAGWALEAGAPDVGLADEAGGIPYDEWDPARGAYLPAWCTLFVEPPPPPDRAAGAAALRTAERAHGGAVRALRAELERALGARRVALRQEDGDDFDLSQLVDHLTARAAGAEGPSRVYQRRAEPEPDLAIGFLCDLSLSTDAWVQNRRVIDTCREVLAIFGAAIEGTPVPAFVGGFSSNTRRDCRFMVLKRFEEDWATGVGRFRTVEPRGYTRIGPAIRHATAILGPSRARRKVLFVVGDGKPTDYDRYEGRHGLGDVRQALSEGRGRGVRAIGVGADPAARGALAAMFGAGGFVAASDPLVLASMAAGLVARAVRRRGRARRGGPL